MTATEEKPARKRAKAREPAPEQKELPGVETRKKIPALNKAARAYKAALKDRQDALALEVQLKNKLIELMHDHKEEVGTVYRDGDIIITLDSKETIKVKSPSDDSEEEADAED